MMGQRVEDGQTVPAGRGRKEKKEEVDISKTSSKLQPP